MRTRVVQLVCLMFSASGTVVAGDAGADQPNVIVLVASGCGWEQAMDWRQGGSLDALVRLRDQGANLRRFHGNPVAAPGHAELLTGRHFLRNGVSGDGGGEQLLHELEVTLAEVCESAGYATGFFGWWRHGSQPPQHPVSQGFSRFAGRCRADWESDRNWIQRGLGPETAVTDPWNGIVSEAEAFVEESRGRPFLCWVTVPPGEKGLIVLNRMAGALSAQVDADARAGRTLTILVSDRPDAYGSSKLFGGPGSLSEGGVRIPGFWHWPGVIEPGLTIHDIAQNVDLFVTVAGLARARMPDDRPMDGMNLWPLLGNQRPERWPNRDIGNVVVRGRDPSTARTSFRNTNWLAVRDPGTRRNPELAPGERWELFDLQADPLQLYEVGGEYPFVLARLKSDFVRWYLQVSQFDLEPVPLWLGPPGAPDLWLREEDAERVGSSVLRWHLKTAGKVGVRVDWQASRDADRPPWTLRIDGRLLTAKSHGEQWSFGELEEVEGRIEVVVDGETEGFARTGHLVFKRITP